LKTLFADARYRGPKLATALAKVLPHLDVAIVKRSDIAIGFKIVPKRWIVERTIVAQSLPKTDQGLGKPQSHGARLLARLPSIRLMLKKPCNPL
jgi:transposase